MDHFPDRPMSLATLQQYLDALERAMLAIEAARRLRPNHGLDHAVERLRAMLYDGALEMQARLPEP